MVNLTRVVGMAVERLALREYSPGHLAVFPQALISVDGADLLGLILLLVSETPDVHQGGCKNSSRSNDA